MLSLKLCAQCLPIKRKPSFAFVNAKSVYKLNSRSFSSPCSATAVPFQQTQNLEDSPYAGVESELLGYVFGKQKATEVAHLVWKHVVRKGDVVVDATCGNGHDTLAMLKMVVDEAGSGCVYALDVQQEALESTSSLLDASVDPPEKQLVKLVNVCHSKMDQIVPKDTFVRLIAFNLGYLPGSDKTVITTSETTIQALEAAERILTPGGLISLVVYIGHLGGREELESVEAFAARLSVDNWVCCKFQMLNRPLAPVLVFMFKRP